MGKKEERKLKLLEKIYLMNSMKKSKILKLRKKKLKKLLKNTKKKSKANWMLK